MKKVKEEWMHIPEDLELTEPMDQEDRLWTIVKDM